MPILRGKTALCTDQKAEDTAELMTQLDELAALYLNGIRLLLLVGTAQPVTGILAMDKGTVDWLNRLLVSRDLDPMAVKRAGAASRAAAVLRAGAEDIAASASRRQLFSRFAPESESGGKPSALAQLQAFGAERSDALFAVAPAIDPSLCTGCDACLRACPADVLTHINDSSSDENYTIDPVGCDACRLCVDLCTPSAIGLDYMTRRPDRTVLTSWTCTACGVHVHAPVKSAATDGLCDICRHTGHHKKLYQVLP